MSKRKPRLDPAIHRVPLEKLTIFEITESELEALEQGSPAPLHLNLGIAAFSVSMSFLVVLCTTTIDDIKTFCVFVIVAVIGTLAAITFGLLYLQGRAKSKSVISDIRKRMPVGGIQENTDDEKPGSPLPN